MAKINRDQLNDVPIENTMEDLKVAYLNMRTRRKMLESHPLPLPARKILTKLERVPSLKELEMLQEEKWVEVIMLREQRGESLPDIVEDVANQDTDEKIRKKAFTTSNSMGCRVQLLSLSPTVRPSSHALAETTVKSEERNILAVGPSPVLSWFKDQPEGPEPEFFAMPMPCDPAAGVVGGINAEAATKLSPKFPGRFLGAPFASKLGPSSRLHQVNDSLSVPRTISDDPGALVSLQLASFRTCNGRSEMYRGGNSFRGLETIARAPTATNRTDKQIRWAIPVVVAPDAPPKSRPPPRRPLPFRWLVLCC
eukprot:GGOE01058885.1.p1 GENE.GGOE01058885.1~~GGOE01058885.1.p1  ORF type:complete len:351 (-),score=98.54 GGOE01058885.1:1251-2180(-)